MNKKILSNDYIMSIINKFVMVVTSFITVALINRYLGPYLKGQYAYIINITNILIVIGNLGIYNSYPKNYKEKIPNVKNKYCNIIIFQFFIYIIIALIVGILSKNWIVICACLIVPTQILANQMSMIIMVEEIKYRQYIQIITLILKTILMLFIYILIPKSLAYIFLLIVLINSIQCLLYAFKLKINLNFKSIDIDLVKKIIKFGVYACLSELLLIFNYKADILMLNSYVDYFQIGLYSVGASLAECIWIIPDAFKEVLFSRTARGNPIKEINSTIKFSLYASIAIIVFCVCFDKEILTIYGGNEFVDGALVMKIILLGVPSMALFKITNPLYLANGKQKQYFYILLFSVIINLILNLICIPIWGIYGAACASIVAYSVCGITFYIFYIKEYNIKWYEPLIIRKRDFKELKKFLQNKL